MQAEEHNFQGEKKLLMGLPIGLQLQTTKAKDSSSDPPFAEIHREPLLGVHDGLGPMRLMTEATANSR
jgi:hypothetical protein